MSFRSDPSETTICALRMVLAMEMSTSAAGYEERRADLARAISWFEDLPDYCPHCGEPILLLSKKVRP